MNKMDKKLMYINAELINGIIFCLGIIATLIGLFIKQSDLKTIVISIGCSLIASSIVSYLSAKYLMRRNKIKDIVEHWGLEGIYRTRQEMNISCDEHMKELENELDIIAFGLRSFRHSQENLIRDKVKKGLKIRILTTHPQSVFLKQREKDEKRLEGEIKKTIEDLIEWINELKQIAPNPDNIQIKLYDTLPLDFYFREDDYVYLGPYLYGKDSQQTISFEFKGPSEGYNYYKNYFETLWNDNNFSKSPSD